MSIYIDADELKDFISRYGGGATVEDCIKWIEQTDAADVRENVKGEWIKLDEEPVYIIKCSECGDKLFNMIGQPLPKFCSNCGADMRGDNDERIFHGDEK